MRGSGPGARHREMDSAMGSSPHGMRTEAEPTLNCKTGLVRGARPRTDGSGMEKGRLALGSPSPASRSFLCAAGEGHGERPGTQALQLTPGVFHPCLEPEEEGIKAQPERDVGLACFRFSSLGRHRSGEPRIAACQASRVEDALGCRGIECRAEDE